MKKILMRAAMPPLSNIKPMHVICKNLIGNNLGNMLFPYSVARTLMCEDVVIDTMTTAKEYSMTEVKRINEEYDCFVFPFANAFRISFMEELCRVTSLIKQLKIPCIVIGVGAQAPVNKEPKSAALDEAVKDFMHAVLEKSNIVGLRGEFTASYLKKLGFVDGKDFTVIGCPSMYAFGKKLPEMEVKELTPLSSVSTNSKLDLPQKFHDFMYRSRQAIPDYYYIPQVIEEINAMAIGKKLPPAFAKKIPNHFPIDFSDPIYKEGKGICFANAQSWLDFLKQRDFSFGSRIHGNIAAILAGTPAFIVVSDARIKELVDYHNIPHIMMKDLNDQTNIFELHQKADFGKLQEGHEARFMHYLDFLHQNGLETIYDENGDVKGCVPFDEIVERTNFYGPVRAFSNLSTEDQVRRLQQYHREMSIRISYYEKLRPPIKLFCKETVRVKVLHKRERCVERFYPLIRSGKPKAKVEDEAAEQGNA